VARRLSTARRGKFGWRRREHFPAAAAAIFSASLSERSNKRYNK